MVRIQVDTTISAPIRTCFDLGRSLSAHVTTTIGTDEKIISRHDNDLLTLGDEVTFEARHLGFRRRLTARIVEFHEPSLFADQMIKGSFRYLRHEHRFQSLANGDTKMTDRVEFSSPYGLVGKLLDHFYLCAYMERFIRRKGLALKVLAEKQALRAENS